MRGQCHDILIGSLEFVIILTKFRRCFAVIVGQIDFRVARSRVSDMTETIKIKIVTTIATTKILFVRQFSVRKIFVFECIGGPGSARCRCRCDMLTFHVIRCINEIDLIVVTIITTTT